MVFVQFSNIKWEFELLSKQKGLGCFIQNTSIAGNVFSVVLTAQI